MLIKSRVAVQASDEQSLGSDSSIYKPFQVVMCHMIDEQERQEMMDFFGVDDFIQKPVSRAQMDAILRKYEVTSDASSIGLPTQARPFIGVEESK